ncbi:PREDICTED: mucin-2 [Gekko japonicus]|uniref:Mucin-2 n=1 Tax=Gekko japonicus TaxID=146911 RepID=A0ABM1K401_GEKJA|nr:PREDICTED: mucin-2 [Gekko japonicus]
MGRRVPSLLILWLALCYASDIKRGRDPSHGHYVCSTWGNNHFKTFDGDFYQFPGLCNYNFASDCQGYKEFSVHIQRELNDQGHPDIQYVLVTVKDVAIYLTHKMVVVDGQIVRTPYYSSGILVEKSDIYTKLYARVGVILLWNREDALMREECEALLTAPAFEDCQSRLNLEQYIQACMQDRCACGQAEDAFCLCSTISEYSRQCSHSGGRPQNWRTSQFCPKSCPGNMIYMESGSPCMDSCSHLEISSLCEEHYMDGCFCPEGTVYDDMTGNGCVATSQCSCKLHGNLYSPGQNITNECENCTCQSGRWICQDLPCPGTCALEGGAHLTTFDGKKYTFHGDCYYVLTKSSKNDSYALLGELGPCGSTDKQTCLKMVVLLLDHMQNIVVFKPDGTVLLNENEVHLPHVSASFSVFQPSSYHIIVQTNFGLKLQIQMAPIMQLFAIADQSVKGTVQGLCGNFNGIEGDDFKTSGGMVEATGAAFANTWKAQSSCADKADKLEHPCTLNLENENYAEHWCSLLKSSESPFARCHSAIDPADYYKRCKYDTCSCDANEECMCAALSSYARACAFKGVMLWGWRNTVCNKEVSSCPATQVFRYNLTVCQQTCRSLSEGDKHCLQGFIPIDGCGCPDNRYLNDKGVCVPVAQCPCYYKGSFIEPGDYFMKQEERCACQHGKLNCVPVIITDHDCSPNKTYFDCNDIASWSSQTPVQLSCQTLGAAHFQTECISGCVCPNGLIDDGRGGCVEEEDCPCIHNKEFYAPGERIDVDCNECTCQNGNWACTQFVCHGACIIYGSGHYITFDGKYYDFDGNCEYIASQDYCGRERHHGSFSIITENVPCGTTGVTCSKAIKVFLGSTELKLEDKEIAVITRDLGNHVKYLTRKVGLYLVVEASNGVMLIWDTKTTIFIKLTPNYKGKVCGLCGNFDDKANNDFTTRSQVQVNNALDFGNSWKRDSACPDVDVDIEPCDQKPHRKSWAEKECGLITSEVFAVCHPKVNPKQFYEACVHDACACDSGGDCECFCTAVAAYAQECIKAEACVFWRTPDICPIFCDYYNPKDICKWHYEPCGREIMTCKMLNNIATNFSVPYLEGCYPRCPPETPIFNEETFNCTTAEFCDCYVEGKPYPPGSRVPTDQLCGECICLHAGNVSCGRRPDCCVYNGTEYGKGDSVVVENGALCYNLTCENDTMVPSNPFPCVPVSTTVPTTTTTVIPSSTSTASTTTTTSTSTSISSTTNCYEICQWSQWYDVSKPKDEPGGGDYETYENIRKKYGDSFCSAPQNIECRATNSPDQSLEELGQKVKCNVTYGLVCRNEDQDKSLWDLCYNYEIRVNCCSIYCGPPTTTTITTTKLPTTTTTPSTTTPTTTSTPTPTPTTTTQSTSETSPTTSLSPTTTTTTPTPTPTTPTPTTTTTPETPTSTTTSPSTTTTTSTPTPSTTSTTSGSTTAPCTEFCEWSKWIDVSYPRYGPENGDYETYDNIRAHGIEVCSNPLNISCRAVKYPGLSFQELGQKVKCDVSTGLVCHNKEQVPGPVMPADACLNYEISIYCCSIICATTPISTTTPSTTTTPETTTSTTTTTTSTPTPSTPSTTSGPTTAVCTPSTEFCEWSEWIDVSYPRYGPENGDYETYDNIRAHGIEVCSNPLNISCRAVKYPGLSFQELGQKVKCDVSTGLVCHNKEQVPGPVMPADACLNYEISIYCCSIICTTTPITTTTPSTTAPTSSLSTTTSTPTPTPTTPTPTTTTTPETSTSTITSPSTTTTTSTPTPSTISTTSGSTTDFNSEDDYIHNHINHPNNHHHSYSDAKYNYSTPYHYPELPTTTPTETSSTTTSTTPITTTTPTQTPSTTTAPPTTTPVPTTTTELPTTTPTETSSTTTSTTPITTTTPTQTPKLPTTTPTETSSTTTSTTPITTTTPTQTPSTTTAPPTTTPVPTTTTELPTTTTEASTTTTSTTPITTTTPTQTPNRVFPLGLSINYNHSSANYNHSSANYKHSSANYNHSSANYKHSSANYKHSSANYNHTKHHNFSTCDSWWICNCTQAICITNDTWEVVPVECVPPPEPQCSNKLAPVRVLDDNGCCWHWECDCYCTGWGDPHYKTFDGFYYSYQGNCTYTLVEEINKKVDNFGVYIDNYHCDPREPVSCPRTLIVRHETQEVRITTVREVPMKVQVLINGQTVALPYKKYGLKVYEVGVNQVVEIPELKMNVTYNGMAFTIRLPYQLFGNNTQGQCGTCTNNTADDCRLRNGTLASSCEVMADNWIVNDPSKPQCFPQLPPSGPTQAPPLSPCKPSPLCELLRKGVFEKCHGAVVAQNYYEACLFDSCRIPNRNIECATLQIYAATCADQGVCIDWREFTNGSCCKYPCPSNKIYKACGPSEEKTCKSGSITVANETQVEGCFCPEGTTLYDSGVDVCVKTCGCVGPDNIPRAFGETFEFDCKDCVCLEGGAGIICEDHKCPPAVDDSQCEGEGFYKISEVNPDDKCCSKTTCAPKGVCVSNGAEYKPGSKVLGGECQDCVCTHEWNNSTNLKAIHCDHIPCSVSCEEPGQRRSDPKNNCTIYSCVSINGQLISSTSTINCPSFNETICEPDTITYLPNGCCKTCIPKEPQTPPPCSLTVIKDKIKYNGCSSVEQVSVSQCQGTCGTYSRYSAEANSMQHKCRCCREEKTTKKAVTLTCPDGSSLTHLYLHVESCKCQNTECNEAASSEQTSAKRRRRQLTRE